MGLPGANRYSLLFERKPPCSSCGVPRALQPAGDGNCPLLPAAVADYRGVAADCARRCACYRRARAGTGTGFECRKRGQICRAGCRAACQTHRLSQGGEDQEARRDGQECLCQDVRRATNASGAVAPRYWQLAVPAARHCSRYWPLAVPADRHCPRYWPLAVPADRHCPRYWQLAVPADRHCPRYWQLAVPAARH